MSVSMKSLSKPKLFAESSGSLRREKSSSWSFPKAQRFLSLAHPTDVPLLQLPSTLGSRFTTLGKGARYSFILNDNPPPDFYNVPSQFDPFMRKQGTVFGPIPFKNSSKLKDTPGPGTYQVTRGFIAQNKGVKLKSRKVIHDYNVENPAPNCYNISEKIIKKGRYLEISIGRGKRYDFFKGGSFYIGNQDIPGPGTYTLSSKFDRFSTPMIRSKLSLSQNNKLAESFYA